MMQELLLADNLFADIRSGLKQATTRRGKRDVELGPLRFRAAVGDDAEVVNVCRVSFTRLSALTFYDAVVEGYRKADELRAALTNHYADLKPEEVVTVIEFR